MAKPFCHRAGLPAIPRPKAVFAGRLRASPLFLRNMVGSVAVEFAIVSPVLILLLLGIMSYGGYFWISHNIQELANDAARAAVAGLTDSERTSLAQACLNTEIADYSVLNPALATVTYQGSSESFTVSVSYNASSTPFWAASGIIPMPPQTIVESASIRLGGY
jgi:Flp pilus assembly protein TadG